MAQALGIGGVFFTAQQPEQLRSWYQEHLGLPADGRFLPGTMPENGGTVWAPFEAKPEYFNPSERGCMINFVVDDLDAMLAQVQAGGAELVGEIEEYPYGRFGWFLDPEGYKIELWEPIT